MKYNDCYNLFSSLQKRGIRKDGEGKERNWRGKKSDKRQRYTLDHLHQKSRTAPHYTCLAFLVLGHATANKFKN